MPRNAKISRDCLSERRSHGLTICAWSITENSIDLSSWHNWLTAPEDLPTTMT